MENIHCGEFDDSCDFDRNKDALATILDELRGILKPRVGDNAIDVNTVHNSNAVGDDTKEDGFMPDDEFTNIMDSLHACSLNDVSRRYRNFMERKPNFMKIADVGETLSRRCCSEECSFKFSINNVMDARLIFPAVLRDEKKSKRSHYARVDDIFFNKIRDAYQDRMFLPIFRGHYICKEFFARLYCIPRNRLKQIMLRVESGAVSSKGHGNSDPNKKERDATCQLIGRIVNAVEELCEPRPNGNGYNMPSHLTKRAFINMVIPDSKVQLNPTRLLKTVSSTLHFQTCNDLTKCDTCITLNVWLESNVLNAVDAARAEQYLVSHYSNVLLDRRDYAVRAEASRAQNGLLSLTIDAASKDSTKFPRLLDNRTKKLADNDKQMCTLTLVIVHRKYNDTDNTFHLNWNVDNMESANSNMMVSLLYHAISHTPNVPSNISVQCDNCPVNKCYNTLGALALLLYFVPQLRRIYVCLPEVGHTHADADREFGVMDTQLERKEINSPQGYVRFTNALWNAVASNRLVPTIYDFENILGDNLVRHGYLQKYHFFELSLNGKNEAVVRIAKFIRSEKFIYPPKSTDTPVFQVFKNMPNPELHPAVVPPKPYDVERHSAVCRKVRWAMSETDHEELQDLPNVLTQQPVEEFSALLERLQSNMCEAPVDVPQISDLENEGIERFLHDMKIKRDWQKNHPSTNAVAETVSVDTDELPVAQPAVDAESDTDVPPPPKRQPIRCRTVQETLPTDTDELPVAQPSSVDAPLPSNRQPCRRRLVQETQPVDQESTEPDASTSPSLPRRSARHQNAVSHVANVVTEPRTRKRVQPRNT
uniref:ATP-dependent DNA helicase n=1 Tax=Panagrellus redivivus TaxID=6233 RepID=A0A7E4UQ31_PANRE